MGDEREKQERQKERREREREPPLHQQLSLMLMSTSLETDSRKIAPGSH
jgi:hypothetical protein